LSCGVNGAGRTRFGGHLDEDFVSLLQNPLQGQHDDDDLSEDLDTELPDEAGDADRAKKGKQKKNKLFIAAVCGVVGLMMAMQWLLSSSGGGANSRAFAAIEPIREDRSAEARNATKGFFYRNFCQGVKRSIYCGK
jgi:hypothetical protein